MCSNIKLKLNLKDKIFLHIQFFFIKIFSLIFYENFNISENKIINVEIAKVVGYLKS